MTANVESLPAIEKLFASQLYSSLEELRDEIGDSFFDDARLNPSVSLITGVICGVRVEEIEDPLMQKIRYLDKLVDELARGKKMATILRAAV